jgi:hypothetical protein
MADYNPPIATFLTLGEAREDAEWRDYVATYGISNADIPELIRMATDLDLNQADSESTLVWAPIHAWRTLGQLRAEEAVAPLLQFLDWAAEHHDDYALEDMPYVFEAIGPPAIPALAAFLADDSKQLWARSAALNGLQKIAERHPEERDRCVDIITRQLGAAALNAPDYNGFLLAALLDLKAVEAAPVIERAFEGGYIDDSIAGDWEYAQWELGLSDKPPARRRYVGPAMAGLQPMQGPHNPREKAKARAKARRKQAAKSRKQNRKNRKK